MLLERYTRMRQASAGLRVRAGLLVKMLDGANNSKAARELDLHRDTARLWRERWRSAALRLEQAEREADPSDDAGLMAVLEDLLSDQPRPGTPATFSPEQIVAIVAVGCEEPKASGYPVSHWTPGDLRREVIKRQIVETISARQVGRFLKRSQPQAAPLTLLA
jgi:putative transposase